MFDMCQRRVEAKKEKKSFGTLVRHVLYEYFTGVGHQSKECQKMIFFGHQSELSNMCHKSVIRVSETSPI
jgi:hypothetical protein